MGFVLFLAGCGTGGVGADQPGDNLSSDTADFVGDDTTPPSISFVEPERGLPSGEDVVLDAGIGDDESGVFTATLYFRNETDGSKDWKSTAFVNVGSDLWQATIQADEQHSAGMWYYLRAVDRSQNETFFPEDWSSKPLHFEYTD